MQTGYGRGAVGDTELAVDVLEMLGDRPGAYAESPGDGIICAAGGYEFQDLSFPVGQDA